MEKREDSRKWDGNTSRTGQGENKVIEQEIKRVGTCLKLKYFYLFLALILVLDSPSQELDFDY